MLTEIEHVLGLGVAVVLLIAFLILGTIVTIFSIIFLLAAIGTVVGWLALFFQYSGMWMQNEIVRLKQSNAPAPNCSKINP